MNELEEIKSMILDSYFQIYQEDQEISYMNPLGDILNFLNLIYISNGQEKFVKDYGSDFVLNPQDIAFKQNYPPLCRAPMTDQEFRECFIKYHSPDFDENDSFFFSNVPLNNIAIDFDEDINFNVADSDNERYESDSDYSFN